MYLTRIACMECVHFVSSSITSIESNSFAILHYTEFCHLLQRADTLTFSQ